MKRTKKKRSQLLEWLIFLAILIVIGSVWYISWKNQRFVPVDSTRPASMSVSNQMQIYTLTFVGGQDLKQCIENFVIEQEIESGVILSCTGKLRNAILRLANQNGPSHWKNNYEIVSLNGTLSPNNMHLHIALSDGKGKTIGGQLMDGCMITSGVEIVIGALSGTSD